MRKVRRLGWWGLFALMPLTVVLIVLDYKAPLSGTWHLVLLAATVAAICVLAIAWAERNPELMEREGADALIGYLPLPGTIEAVDGEPAVQEPLKAGRHRFVSGYDPMTSPPVVHRRLRDAVGESPS
jgi:hypothetical protein